MGPRSSKNMGRKRTKDTHKSKNIQTIGDKRLMSVFEGSNKGQYKTHIIVILHFSKKEKN